MGKEPPKDGEKHKKQVGKYTYLWCEHHMAWTVHKPADCLLGKQHKEEQKKKPQKANCTTIAAAATSSINPHFYRPYGLSGQPGRMMMHASMHVLHIGSMRGRAK
jgi:hypothetical protein